MTSSEPRQKTAYEQARLALADPNATAEQLLNGALGLEGAFIRNEHLIGLLPGDSPEVMQAAYRAADAKGSRKAGLIWVRRAYFERAEPVAAAAARIDELTANDPDGEAHLVRGWMRQQGYGFDQDLVASAADLQVAAGLGNLDAVFELYIMAATGQGVAQDADQAQAYLEQAAQGGHRRALYNLAANYATGRGVAKDSARALQLYIQAAEKGNAQAAWTAALMLLTGEAGVVDLEAAGVLLVEAEDLARRWFGAVAPRSLRTAQAIEKSRARASPRAPPCPIPSRHRRYQPVPSARTSRTIPTQLYIGQREIATARASSGLSTCRRR